MPRARKLTVIETQTILAARAYVRAVLGEATPARQAHAEQVLIERGRALAVLRMHGRIPIGGLGRKNDKIITLACMFSVADITHGTRAIRFVRLADALGEDAPARAS